MKRRPADVAIVGMAGLFPQAPSVEVFWANILSKVDAISEGSPEWLCDEVLLDQEMKDPPRLYTRSGGFLGGLAKFDPMSHGIMPLALNGSEPDQFLALRCAAEALADAGYAKRAYDSSRTGIILGHAVHANRASVNGVQHALVLDQTIGMLRQLFNSVDEASLAAVRKLLKRKLPGLSGDTAPGLVPNMMTGRIANRLNLMGPNYILDAACASSLLAVDAAIAELRAHRCDMMLAGGINTSTSSMVYMLFCELGALSRRSRIRPFDREADGTLLGEGQAIVVLKRLEDAQRDDDRIYAVIKGAGSSSDGRALGLMAPRREGEILAMQRAYQQSGIDPGTVGLVEAHGTGIPLGDRTEIEALRAVFGGRRRRFPDLALGSVKSNIGHCIPAAGAAALIKMALALHHKVLPPTLCGEVNPELGLESTRLFVNTELTPWVHAGPVPRRAAINAFGFGGINSHMILEEPPGQSGVAEPGAAFGLHSRLCQEVIIFAEESREALVAAVEALRQQLTQSQITDTAAIAALCANEAKDAPCRLAIVTNGAGDLASKLTHAARRLHDPTVDRLHTRTGIYFSTRPVEGKVAFLFPGENSQYVGMLRDLLIWSPAAREWFDFLDGLFGTTRELPHRVLLFPPGGGLASDERLALEQELLQVDTGSEAVFFADQSLYTLLRAFGITPDFMVGHSTGENAALVASGMLGFTREQVGEYIVEMNRIYQRLEDERAVQTGVLLTVGALARGKLNAILERYPDVDFTMDNCPNQAILFGAEDRMAELSKELASEGAVCLRLPLSWAYHTAAVAPMAEAFSELFQRVVAMKCPIAPLYSCATASRFPETLDDIRHVSVAQYTSRVRFTETIERLFDEGARIFVEVGPSGFLTGFVRDILQERPHVAVATDVRRAGSLEQFHRLLAQLYVSGVPIDWATRYPKRTDAQRSDAPKRSELSILSELPFIHLSQEEAAEVRRLLGLSERVAVQPVVAETAPASIGAPAGNGAHATQGAGAVWPPRAVVRRIAHRGSRHGHAPAINRWTQWYTPAHPTEIFAAAPVASGNRPLAMYDLEWLAAQVLSSDEKVYWSERLVGRHPRRSKEWLLARFAGKEAVRSWLSVSAHRRAALSEIEILYDAEGRPTVTLQGSSAELGPSPSISISHVNGLAVAAACGKQVGLGIDLECIDRIQDGNEILRRIATPAERNSLEERLSAPSAELAALIWAVKEASAKAHGIGFLDKAQSFVVTKLSADGARAVVQHRASTVEVEVARFERYLCALAQVVH